MATHKKLILIKKAAIFTLLFMILSCSEQQYIYYTYKGVTITRINNPGESYFYYGYYTNSNKLPSSFIKASYSGRDGMMDGFLIFYKNKQVGLEGDGFNKIGKDSLLFLKQFPDFISNSAWYDSVVIHDWDSMVEVTNLIKPEKENNAKQHSKVKANY